MTDTLPSFSAERRLSHGASVPTFFCRSDTSDEPFIAPWMDMDTGDTFEATELAAHPHAMENIQLRSAYVAFKAARARQLSVSEALREIAEHALCPLTCESMRQPVRAPDNILYEADALMTSLRRWKGISPVTRAPFPEQVILTTDRRMQQLSAACGDHGVGEASVMVQYHIRLPCFAPTPEAMEEGRAESLATRHGIANLRGLMRPFEGAITGIMVGVLLHHLMVPVPLNCLGGAVFFAGATMIPADALKKMWPAPRTS